jgi:hypothetical protein
MKLQLLGKFLALCNNMDELTSDETLIITTIHHQKQLLAGYRMPTQRKKSQNIEVHPNRYLFN